MNKLPICFLFALLFFVCLAPPNGYSQTYHYPRPSRVDTVDDYYGTKVADPYRWMENLDSKELKEWINAENMVTREYMNKIFVRDNIQARLTELWNYPKYSFQQRAGNKYIFSYNSGLQNQSVVYMQEIGKTDSSLVIDPNTLSRDGTVALSRLIGGQWGGSVVISPLECVDTRFGDVI